MWVEKVIVFEEFDGYFYVLKKIVMKATHFDDLKMIMKVIGIYYDNSHVFTDVFYSMVIMIILFRAMWVSHYSMHIFLWIFVI